MASPLPPGRFRDAMIRRGYSILTWVCWWFVGLALILFTPWARVFDGEDKPAIAPRAWQVISRGEPLEMWPFAFAIIGLLIFMGLYGLWRGLNSVLTPHKASPVGLLKPFGDPDRLIAEFEAEARTPAFDVQKPRILITRSWLMFGDSIEVHLHPLSDVLWAYGHQGKAGRVVAGLMGAAGVISSRQQQLAGQALDPDELYLVLHVRSDSEPVKLNVKSALDDVLKFLLVHAPHMVIGHDDHLNQMWKADPEAFARYGRGLGGLQTQG